MFSGIVEALGQVVALERRPAGLRLRIAAAFPDPPAVGESIATNGVCLTALLPSSTGYEADVSEETASRTSLGALRPGDVVNLERSLRVGDRISGHFVFGHVDAVGTVREVRPQGDGRWIRVAAPASMSGFLVDKGSIAVDGISLTMCDCDDQSFAIAVIPHTLSATNLHSRTEGDPVNLEADMLARYVRRVLESRGA